jgi:hypothetical protein
LDAWRRRQKDSLYVNTKAEDALLVLISPFFNKKGQEGVHIYAVTHTLSSLAWKLAGL